MFFKWHATTIGDLQVVVVFRSIEDGNNYKTIAITSL
jgi:hypothetical protein